MKTGVVRIAIPLALALAATAPARAQMCPADLTGDGRVGAADVAAVVQAVGSGTCFAEEQAVELLERLGYALELVVGLPEIEEFYFPRYDFESLEVEDGIPILFGSDQDGFGVAVGVFQDGGLPLAILAAAEEICDFTVMGYAFTGDTVLAGVNYGVEDIDNCGGDFIDGPNPASGEALFLGASGGDAARAKRRGARPTASRPRARATIPAGHRDRLPRLQRALAARSMRH